MATYQDKSGQWRYRILIKLPDGEKRRISGTPEVNKKSAAIAEERNHIAREKNPAHKGPAAPAFDAFAREWLKKHCTIAQNRDSSREEKRSHIENHLIPHLQAIPLDQITKAKILDLIAHLNEKPAANHQADRGRAMRGEHAGPLAGKKLAPKTVRNVLQNLAKILRSAHEWERLKVLPDFPKIKVPKSSFDFLTEAEAMQLLAACRDDEERLEFQLALDTGARVSEQLAIEWRDIDWVNHRIWIKRQLYKGTLGPPKAGGDRVIEMTPALEALLKRVMEKRDAAYTHRDPAIVPPSSSKVQVSRTATQSRIFVDAFGRSRTYSHFVGAMRRVRAKAGLRHLGWHCLRHSFASQLVMRGCPLAMVQKWMGHSTITMTLRYSHLSEGAGAHFLRGLNRGPGPEARA